MRNIDILEHCLCHMYQRNLFCTWTIFFHGHSTLSQCCHADGTGHGTGRDGTVHVHVRPSAGHGHIIMSS